MGLPWFDYYDDGAKGLEGAGILKKLKSVVQMGNEKGDKPVPENQPVSPEHVIRLGSERRGDNRVREGGF